MAFRRSGSFTRFYTIAAPCEPEDAEFLKLIRKQRFKSIENEAAEVESVGWVSPLDPTGVSWRLADLVHGRHLFLKLRIDRKTLPAAWLRVRLASAEQAEKDAGKRVGRARRQELREELAPELLERVLPAISLSDVVWNLDRRQVWLFSGGQRTREAFAALFARTFGGDPPVAVTCETFVAHARLPAAARAAWEELATVSFASSSPARRPAAEGAP